MKHPTKKFLFHCSLLIITLIFFGCPPAKETKKEETPVIKKPIAPDIIIQVASLDLSKLTRKIEKSDVEKLSQLLKKHKIDILALENITRYPGVTTRIDIVDELAAQSGMRQAFGESANLNGRQTGNAVFSNYPIVSSNTTPYNGLQSSDFESALQASVDCGAREVVVVSTHIPMNATIADNTICATTLSSFTTLYTNHPIIVAGNLPTLDDLKKLAGYNEVKKNSQAPSFWYSNDGSLKLMNQKTETTPLGTMAIAEFGIFRQRQP